MEHGGAQPMHSLASHWRENCQRRPFLPNQASHAVHTTFSSNYTTSWILGRTTPQITSLLALLLATLLGHIPGKSHMANQGNLRLHREQLDPSDQPKSKPQLPHPVGVVHPFPPRRFSESLSSTGQFNNFGANYPPPPGPPPGYGR